MKSKEEIERLQYAAQELIKKIGDNVEKAPEGIFRLSALKSELEDQKRKILLGHMEFSTNMVENADLLKTVLRELKNSGKPILGEFDEFKDLSNITGNEKIIAVRLLELLDKVAKNENTKMDATNLAIVIAPNLFSQQELDPDPIKEIAKLSVQKGVVEELIKNAENIDLTAGEIQRPTISLRSTYKHQVDSEAQSRRYLINFTGRKLDTEEFKGFKGDLLKSKILADFKSQIEATTNEEDLNTLEKELMDSKEYKKLEKGQGVVTKMRHFFQGVDSKDTSSIKTFKAMVAEQRENIEKIQPQQPK